ncbi:MAG: iron-containing alcohol dehydrogenase [Planctomycetes bacterium]|nr:iron-containing alcohol dehydrogenase [Planctomycetota bacterium]
MILVDSDTPVTLDHSPVRVVYGPGRLETLGRLVRAEGASRVLLVTDRGIAAAGHLALAVQSLRFAGVPVEVFQQVHENPTTDDVAACVEAAIAAHADFFIALGGGSSMDCTKGANLLVTNGGRMADYRGEGKVTKPLLPMVAVPTTAGTGSEAQSFALISDAATKEKMVCGDRRLPTEGGLRPRAVILDPALTRTVPHRVAAAAGIDAIAHAVETAGCRTRNAASLECSRMAWELLSRGYEPALRDADDGAARAMMLVGAHFAGIAIERSMLGAAHACANPLTARFGIAHGFAVGLMLPHVVRFNAAGGPNPYAALQDDAGGLAERIDGWLDAGRIPRRLGDHGVKADDLPELAARAAGQWTAGFNPRPVGEAELLEVYRRAM